MRIFALLLALTLPACGSKPPPKTERLKADMAACQKNLDGINARVRQLTAEKLKVMQNRESLPADYDKTSIDRTLAQIDSELTMRQSSSAAMTERCNTISDKLHAAEMAQPL